MGKRDGGVERGKLAGCGGLMYLVIIFIVFGTVFSLGGKGDLEDKESGTEGEQEYKEDTATKERVESEARYIEETYGGGDNTYEDFINNKDDFLKLLSINSSLTDRERMDAERYLEDVGVTWDGVVVNITKNHINLVPEEIVGRDEFVHVKEGEYFYAPKDTVYYETIDVKNVGYAKNLGLEVGDEVTIKGSLRYIPHFPGTLDWRINDGEVVEERGNIFK